MIVLNNPFMCELGCIYTSLGISKGCIYKMDLSFCFYDTTYILIRHFKWKNNWSKYSTFNDFSLCHHIFCLNFICYPKETFYNIISIFLEEMEFSWYNLFNESHQRVKLANQIFYIGMPLVLAEGLFFKG